jgi:Holliday junction DNA helicase RuvB
MVEIVKRSAAVLEAPITDGAALQIAVRSRQTPRLANRLLKRARDLLHVQGYTQIDETSLENLFQLLEIDTAGLTDIDRQYLRTILHTFENRPVGIETISAALAEDLRTVEDFIEPYLLQMGFIQKTARGRIVTPAGIEHMK